MRYVSDERQESSDDGRSDSSEDESEGEDGSQLSGAEERPGGARRGGKPSCMSELGSAVK